MKNLFENYKGFLRAIVILILVCIVITIANVGIRRIIVASDSRDKNALTLEELIKNENYDAIDYNIIKKDIENIRVYLEDSKNANVKGKTNMVIFYENASKVVNEKLNNIIDILVRKLIDADSVNELHYSIARFRSELVSDEENVKRIYESSVDANMEMYKLRYERLLNKCSDLIEDYKPILDK